MRTSSAIDGSYDKKVFQQLLKLLKKTGQLVTNKLT